MLENNEIVKSSAPETTSLKMMDGKRDAGSYPLIVKGVDPTEVDYDLENKKSTARDDPINLDQLSDTDRALKAPKQQREYLEESDDQKSSVYWYQQVDLAKEKKVALEEELETRRHQVTEKERELGEVTRKILYAKQMLQIAEMKDEIMEGIEGGPERKLAVINNAQLVWNLLENKDLSTDEIVEKFMTIRQKIRSEWPRTSCLFKDRQESSDNFKKPSEKQKTGPSVTNPIQSGEEHVVMDLVEPPAPKKSKFFAKVGKVVEQDEAELMDVAMNEVDGKKNIEKGNEKISIGKDGK